MIEQLLVRHHVRGPLHPLDALSRAIDEVATFAPPESASVHAMRHDVARAEQRLANAVRRFAVTRSRRDAREAETAARLYVEARRRAAKEFEA